MKPLYKIKLVKGHKAGPDQSVNGYLGNSLFANGKIYYYGKKEARRLAEKYGGVIKKRSPSDVRGEIKYIEQKQMELDLELQKLQDAKLKLQGVLREMYYKGKKPLVVVADKD